MPSMPVSRRDSAQAPFPKCSLSWSLSPSWRNLQLDQGAFFFWGGADYRPQYPNIIWYNCVSGNVGKVWERNDKLWNLVQKCWDTPNWSTGVGSSNIHHLQRKQCCNEKRKQSSGQFFLKSNFLGCPKDLPEVVALHQCKSVTSHYSKTQRSPACTDHYMRAILRST